MTAIKTRKEIIEQLDESAAKVQTLEASIETLNTEHAAEIESKDSEIASKDATIGTLNAEIETAKADIEAAKAEATAKAEELATAKAELEASRKALKVAEAKLENPAYRDAASQGGKPLTDTPTAEGSNYIEQYHAITDPQLKTAFWNKHQNEIKNEMKQMASR